MALDDTKRDFKVIGQRVVRPDGIDKVTGKAQYGADLILPGMLWGAVVRSPHAHAKILKIDASEALKLDGVEAVVTRADFVEQKGDNFADNLDNIMAGKKALYDGHAVAAVAATSQRLANKAAKLVKVEYEILPHVTEVDEAMKADAPVLHEGRKYTGAPAGSGPNVTHYQDYGHGDLDAGFAKADMVIERSFKSEGVHQGYIEPHACVANYNTDGRGETWVCTQGPFMIRDFTAAFNGFNISQVRVTPSEIGGGFGGKAHIFIEPVAAALSKKTGRPVKMAMTRSEVLRATGPTISGHIDVKIGMKKDGTITAGYLGMRAQGGAYPSGTVDMATQAAFAAYDLENVKSEGWNVVTNRPKEAAYRAPGAPLGVWGVESVLDELCQELNLDPMEVRIKNAAKKGTKSSYGPTFDDMGLLTALEAAKAHPHWNAPLDGPNKGRGLSCGFWFNFGGATSVSLQINSDGTASVTEGNPDIGGSRASISMMAAETLGLPFEKVRTIVADTNSIGFNQETNGSRVTFAVGLATIKAAEAAIKVMCGRAAKIWGIDEEAVDWVDGAAVPSGPNAGDFPPMTLAEIAKVAVQTGGPIAGHHEVTADGAGVSFGVHIADVEVDPETGKTTVLRYTAFQDAGKAIHPDYVEGQMQGGAVQGIGWALNEEYIYGADGRLQNDGFLDYRIPVASDLPMIDAVILEIPNPGHPYGVRGVGETGIVPPLAAIGNAVSRATGVRMTKLPMSPPTVLKAIS